MKSLYYYTAMIGAVVLALLFQQYLFLLAVIAIAMPILSHYHKKGWRKKIYTVILYNEDMNEICRFEGIKAWAPQQAYYSVRSKKKHSFWDTEMPLEEKRSREMLSKKRKHRTSS